MYENYPYGLFNMYSINQSMTEWQLQLKDFEQKRNATTMVKAISDFCANAKIVAPEYHKMVKDACMAEIILQMRNT